MATNVRVTQAYIEALYTVITNARMTQMYVEVLYTTASRQAAQGGAVG